MQSQNNNYERVLQLEKSILNNPQYNKLYFDKKNTLNLLKSKSVNLSWEEFDDFICADNEHCFFYYVLFL